MAIVIKYDVATNYVTGKIKSAHTPDFEGQSGYVINPDTSGLDPDFKKWIFDNGSLRNMTQAEYDAAYPAPPPPPNWKQLRNDMFSSPDWNRVKKANDADVVGLLYSYVIMIEQGLDYYDSLIEVWNSILKSKAGITQAEAASIRTLLQNNNIPLQLSDDGVISKSQ